MKRFSLIFSLFLTIIAISLPSCNSSSTDDDTQEALFDIVTLLTSNESGSTFSVQKNDDTTPVKLSCTTRIDTSLIGKRLLIGYYLPTNVAQYTNSSITLAGARTVINDTVKVASADSFTNESQNSLIRKVIGNYLDIMSECDVYSAPAKFELVLDKSTVNSAVPTVYLVFNTDKQINASTKTIYASFDISSLRNNPTYTGFKLVWKPNRTNVASDTTFKFSNKLTPIQPTE